LQHFGHSVKHVALVLPLFAVPLTVDGYGLLGILRGKSVEFRKGITQGRAYEFGQGREILYFDPKGAQCVGGAFQDPLAGVNQHAVHIEQQKIVFHTNLPRKFLSRMMQYNKKDCRMQGVSQNLLTFFWNCVKF
jgi:hypothetical protein